MELLRDPGRKRESDADELARQGALFIRPYVSGMSRLSPLETLGGFREG